MSVSRLIVALPVLAGLVVTGTAAARMMPADSVRSSVYPTCAHNGVHFNKQGHANCGLHKGWQSAPIIAPEAPVTITGTVVMPTAPLGIGLVRHTRPSHSAKPVQIDVTDAGKGHAAKSRGKSSHNKHG
jgi:hypothetical protein